MLAVKKILQFIGWTIAIVLVLLFTAGEGFLRYKGITPGQHVRLKVEPRNFFVPDSLLGWKVREGVYTVSTWDSSNLFKATITPGGSRVVSDHYTVLNVNTHPCLQVYGCSYIFGFSAMDTDVCCYKLQHLLPQVRVENKGVPGYGLAQMFLLLQQTVAAGDTPDLAIFNYANFHDMRTPLHRSWSTLIGYAVSQGYSSGFRQMNYPYYTYANDSLQLHYCAFPEMTKGWPGREHSSVITAMNIVYDFLMDRKNDAYFHRVSEHTALAMLRYCKAHGIKPVLASVTPENTDILKLVAAQGFDTLNYGIKVMNDGDEPNAYNYGKADPQHPNGVAHTVYAHAMYDFWERNYLTLQP